jgi:DNA-binding transcriptional LysR family regulator
MKIDTLGVQAFVAIAEEGSFRKAADTLHITQTALTRRLQNLEESLAVRLIERTTRSVALTPIGREFLPQGHRLLTELGSVLRDIRETGKAQRGDFTMACVPTVGIQFLPRVMQEYAAKHRDNRIRILDHSSAGVAGAVLRREAEFGINIGGPHHSDLAAEPLTEDRIVLLLRDDHPLARRKRLSWSQIAEHPLIFAGEASSNRPLLDAALGTRGIHLHAMYEVQRSSTAVGLVAQGVAAAVVPSLALQKGSYPNLRTVALTDPVIARRLVLVVRKTATLSPAAQALYDMLKERARQASGAA